jgi:hypothetical protein
MSGEILVSVPVHAHPIQLAEQLLNYDHFFGDSHIHIVHVSQGAAPDFIDRLSERAGHLIETGRVILNERSLETSGKSTIGQQIANFEHAYFDLKLPFKKFVIHTSGDLLVRGNFVAYVSAVRFAVGSMALDVNDSVWVHARRLRQDSSFGCLLDTLGIDPTRQLRYGRAEGAVLEPEYVAEISRLLRQHYDLESFARSKMAWPLEEVVFSTSQQALAPEVAVDRHFVYTKPIRDYSVDGNPREHLTNVLTPEDIEDYCSRVKHPFGLKWFSPDMHDPARIMLREMQRHDP